MFILWLVLALALIATAFVLAPRKQPYVPTQAEVAIARQHEYHAFLKDEKDTRRFYEDLRGLYPL
jgi:hypothetical protein